MKLKVIPYFIITSPLLFNHIGFAQNESSYYELLNNIPGIIYNNYVPDRKTVYDAFGFLYESTPTSESVYNKIPAVVTYARDTYNVIDSTSDVVHNAPADLRGWLDLSTASVACVSVGFTSSLAPDKLNNDNRVNTSRGKYCWLDQENWQDSEIVKGYWRLHAPHNYNFKSYYFILKGGDEKYKELAQKCARKCGNPFFIPQPASRLFSGWHTFASAVRNTHALENVRYKILPYVNLSFSHANFGLYSKEETDKTIFDAAKYSYNYNEDTFAGEVVSTNEFKFKTFIEEGLNERSKNIEAAKEAAAVVGRSVRVW